VTAPILRVPDEGTLGAEKHLEAHFDKLLEGGGVRVTPLVGFRLLGPSPLALGSLAGSCLLVCSLYAMALHQSISLSVHSSARLGLRLQPVRSLNSSRQMYVSDYLMSFLRLRKLSLTAHARRRLHAATCTREQRVTCKLSGPCLD
jgi:hypothetical protein